MPLLLIPAKLANFNTGRSDFSLSLSVASSASEVDLLLPKDSTEADEATDKDKEKSDRPVLKLASFAGMSSNGISTSDIVDDPADDETNEPVTGQCALCEKNVNGYKSAVVWETMQF
jgi:hypothetical protein